MRLTLAAVLVATLATAAAHAATFEFAPYAPTNASVPLTIADAGLSATFSSPSGAGAFIAEDGSAFSTLGSAVLANDNFAPEELDIVFSGAVRSIAFAYAIDDVGAPSSLTMIVFNGHTAVADITASGQLAASGLTEGIISFRGVPFTAVSITDPDAPGFAIGSVTAQPVPEPAALIPLGAGLLCLSAIVRRR